MGLVIDTAAITANWRALAARQPQARTAAVVKADGYGLGAVPVVKALAEAGLTDAFVFSAAEGRALHPHFGGRIFVLEGQRAGDDVTGLIPVIASPEQFFRRRPGADFAVQIDTGMNRVGFEPAAWRALRAEILAAGPTLLMSHLACADEPGHPMNARQRDLFAALTADAGVPRSLAATGGILLGEGYGFDLTRPGIGLYGGLPFAEAQPVVSLSLPILQTRHVVAGDSVGYACGWVAPRDSRIATVCGGYADGITRHLAGKGLRLWAGGSACEVVGRVSMDVLTVDVTDLDSVPDSLDLLGPQQGIDAVADLAGTIGYEILTALGRRYPRSVL